MTDQNKYLMQSNFVGGEWIVADNGATMPVYDPATREIIGTIPVSGAVETDRAIEAAAAAFPAWRKRIAQS